MRPGSLGERLNERYVQAGIAVLLFAAALRLYMLGARPLHFDEGQVLFFVHLAIDNADWSYSPALHGPLMFHSASWIIRNVGDAPAFFRLLSVAYGVGIVAAPLFLRREMGERASLLTAALLATSPLMLYYTRFFRSDPALLFFVAVGFVAAVKYVRSRHWIYIPVMGLAAGFAATTKENFPLELGMVTLLLLVLFAARYGREIRAAPGRWARGFAYKLPAFAVAAALGIAVFVFLYAPRPLDPSGFPEVPFAVLDTALEYWGEHSGGHEPYVPYYAALFLMAEPLILVAGVIGAYFAVKERRGLYGFLVAWVLIDVGFYAAFGDGRMPWLGLYALFPMAFLAGKGLDRMVRVWRESDRVGRRVMLVGALILLSGQAVSAAGGNYVWYDEPARIVSPEDLTSYEGSIMVQWAQPDREAKEIVRTLRSEAEKRHGVHWKELRLQVVSDDWLMHPMPWHLREYRDRERVNEPHSDPSAVLVPNEVDGNVRQELDGHEEMVGHLTPGDKLTLFYRPIEGDGG